MKQFILKNRKAITGISAALLIGVVTLSFQDSPVVNQRPDLQQVQEDTLPEKRADRSMTMKEYDNLMESLNKSMLRMGDELKRLDFSSIERSVEKALKEVDMEKIMKEATASLKAVDMDKILADIRSSLKDLDNEKWNEEISTAMAEAKKELEKARIEMKDIDREAIKKAMEKAKVELEKAKAELKNIDMDKIMQRAEEGINKAKGEMRKTKEMFNEMEKDGLISQKDGFSIDYKDKELYINGKKQSEQITDKYRGYFSSDHFSIRIDKE